MGLSSQTLTWPSGHVKAPIPLSQRWERAWVPRLANSSEGGPGDFLQGTAAILELTQRWEPVDQMTPRLWAYSSQMRRRGLACSGCQETLVPLSHQAKTPRLGQLSQWRLDIPQSTAAGPMGGPGPRLITGVPGLGCFRKCGHCLPVLSRPLASEKGSSVSVCGVPRSAAQSPEAGEENVPEIIPWEDPCTRVWGVRVCVAGNHTSIARQDGQENLKQSRAEVVPGQPKEGTEGPDMRAAPSRSPPPSCQRSVPQYGQACLLPGGKTSGARGGGNERAQNSIWSNRKPGVESCCWYLPSGCLTKPGVSHLRRGARHDSLTDCHGDR